MWVSGAGRLVLAIAVLVAGAPAALACIEDVRNAEAYLERTFERNEKAPEKSGTADDLLKDAESQLQDARKQCERANNYFKRQAVSARVLTIRGIILSAEGFIKD